MKLLIANDDGVWAPGIKALANAAESIKAEWNVVAPEKEQSTSGHSLTLHKPLRLNTTALKRFYAVSGKPADCVHIGVYEFGKPDLVVSGINRGANMGQDVFYSGTVSAAREAAVMGLPAIAFSLSIKNYKQIDFKACELVCAKILKLIANKTTLKKWPNGLLLNVNIPQLPFSKIKGFRFATQGRQLYSGRIIRRKDNRGRNYYWIGGKHVGFEKIKGSDCALVNEGYVAITFHHLDTSHSLDHSEVELFAKILGSP